MLIFFFFLFLSSLHLPPRARQENVLQVDNDLCVSITFLPSLTAPFFYFTFPLYLSSNLALLDNAYRHNATATRQRYTPFLLPSFSPPFMITYCPIQSLSLAPLGRRYDTTLGHKHAYTYYSRQPSYSPRRELILTDKSFSHCSVSILLTRACPHPLGEC
jgi:hypothetical protein